MTTGLFDTPTDTTTVRRCPHCAEEISATVTECPHCHRNISSGTIVPLPDASPSSNVWSAIASGVLVVLAILSGGAGLLSLSNATAGVGGVTVACLLAIFARMAQASHHHQAAMAARQQRGSR